MAIRTSHSRTRAHTNTQRHNREWNPNSSGQRKDTEFFLCVFSAISCKKILAPDALRSKAEKSLASLGWLHLSAVRRMTRIPCIVNNFGDGFTLHGVRPDRS